MGVTNQLVLTINTNFQVFPTMTISADPPTVVTADLITSSISADLITPTFQSDASYSNVATVNTPIYTAGNP